MYKQFKKELETKVEELNLKDQKICDRLKKCWQSIDELCSDHNDEDIAKKHQEKPVNIGGWRTVRLFVSSTFTDFYHEREILVKQVFPELREWCESRRIQLIDCDLRWGIPRDTTTGETIAVCLEEIDACHETNSGQPFFLNMTCDRYGWVPEDEDIPEEIKEKYDWVSDTSITFMEVLHGALRRRNQSAFFCLRNNDFISQLPKEHLARFRDADIYSQEQLKIIREKLYERFPEQIFEYSVKYGGIKKVDTDQKMVIIEGLQMFASKVTQYFKSAIEKRYPTPEFQQDISSEEMGNLLLSMGNHTS